MRLRHPTSVVELEVVPCVHSDEEWWTRTSVDVAFADDSAYAPLALFSHPSPEVVRILLAALGWVEVEP